MKYEDCEIVVVDNGSANESVGVLKERFGSNGRVHIIVSEKNLGFAKGNNLGISYAREKLGADFVYVCNSDTVASEGLYDDVLACYEKGVGVITTPIIKPDGSFQKPDENTDSIVKKIRYSVTHLIIGMIMFFVLRQRGNPPSSSVSAEPTDCKKYVLYGCSFFLTPDFFDCYGGLYPKTFLYWEEKNLLFMIHKAALKCAVAETEPVLHKVKGSTVTDDLQAFKLRNAFKSMLKSLPLYFMSLKRISEKY